MPTPTCPPDGSGHGSIPALRFADVQKIDFDDTSAVSAALPDGGVVRLFATAKCHVVIAQPDGETDPVATEDDTPLGAEGAETPAFQSGDKVAVIGRDGDSGSLFITVLL